MMTKYDMTLYSVVYTVTTSLILVAFIIYTAQVNQAGRCSKNSNVYSL